MVDKTAPVSRAFLDAVLSDYAALEQRIQELEAERVRDGLAGQAALDEANNRVRELEVKLEREIELANNAYKLAGIRWKQYDNYEKQAHEITKRELSTLRAENERLKQKFPPECNKSTNSPCEWSGTPHSQDTCIKCGTKFPTWD